MFNNEENLVYLFASLSTELFFFLSEGQIVLECIRIQN